MQLRHFAAGGGAILGLVALTGLPAAQAVNTSAAVRPLLACQSNLSYSDDTGFSVPAQKFGPGYPTLNTAGGASFTVPASGSCTVNYVIVFGRLSGPGPVPKVAVVIKADGTTPGGMHKPSGPNLAPGNGAIVPVALSSPAGYYNIQANLVAPITVSAPPSGPARFWVVFQVKMNPTAGGKWTWEVVTPDPTGESDVWRNPPGGFGCGTAWRPVSYACLGGAPGKGLMMEVGT